MTKQDYIKLAAALKEAMLYAKSGDAGEQRDAAMVAVSYATARIATALQSDNSRFDRDRFLTACGVTP